MKNGSKSYVDAFLARLPSRHQIHLNAAIKSCVRRGNGQVRLVTFAGSTEDFDHVVLAVHANQALTILGEGASSTEREILRQFHTSSNVCVLHNDMSVSFPSNSCYYCISWSHTTSAHATSAKRPCVVELSHAKQWETR